VTTPAPSFRDELERLETIVRSLERDDLDLDRALALFQEGVERLRAARSLLERSELTVRRVLEAADGTLTSESVDR
jgi:exodeoxyribonuclease VII small subunit